MSCTSSAQCLMHRCCIIFSLFIPFLVFSVILFSNYYFSSCCPNLPSQPYPCLPNPLLQVTPGKGSLWLCCARSPTCSKILTHNKCTQTTTTFTVNHLCFHRTAAPGTGFEKGQLKEYEASAGPSPSLPPLQPYLHIINQPFEMKCNCKQPLGCWMVSQQPLAQYYWYLLVYFSGSHGHVAQILSVTVTGVHATACRDAVLEEVRAGAPVGVALNATAAQLGGIRSRFKTHKRNRIKTSTESSWPTL